MFETLDCIALRTVRYNDRHNILSTYTRQRGRLALMVAAGPGRGATRMKALTMPLTQFDCVADIKPGRDIHTVRDLRPASGGVSAASSPVKGTLCLFIADILSTLLRDAQPDESLFDFIASVTRSITTASPRQAANLHIAFLMRLQHFMGIEPDWATWAPGKIFDMAGGIFVGSAPLHGRWLPPDEAEAAYSLRRINIGNAAAWRFSHNDRNTILDRLIRYYQIHFQTLSTVSSLDVLRSVFA